MTIPISGVQFDIYEKESGEKFETVTTDKSGMATVTGLRRNREYYAVEVAASVPEAYRSTDVRYTFQIAADNTPDYPNFIFKDNDIMTVRNETVWLDIPCP